MKCPNCVPCNWCKGSGLNPPGFIGAYCEDCSGTGVEVDCDLHRAQLDEEECFESEK